MRYWHSLDEALQAAREQQERHSYGVMVAEVRDLPNLPVVYVIIPHRDKTMLPHGTTIHYPTPPDQPIMPRVKKHPKRRKVSHCPNCGTEWAGLCPTCYEIRRREILAHQGIDNH